MACETILFNDLVLEKPLGGSGGGTVYEAIRKSANDRVAVKMLRLPKNLRTAIIERYLREAQMVAQLRHPHLVTVYGLGRTPEGGFFVAMELVDGTDLATRIRLHPMPVDAAADAVASVGEALEYSHQRGVIHRDLKPGNILIDAAGQVRVTDFCPLRGTPQYMAPEQVNPRWGLVGPRTDVYGLGALFYTLLLRRPPFPGSNPLEVLSRVVSEEPPPRLAVMCPDIPELLDWICVRCLSKDPRQRFATAGEVAVALQSSHLATACGRGLLVMAT